jgi:hypothetical protein
MNRFVYSFIRLFVLWLTKSCYYVMKKF